MNFLANLDPIQVELAHLASTWGMVGVIWFVQLVHYPLMSRVSRESFPEFEQALCFRTSFVVIPLMTLELATAFLLLSTHSTESLYFISFCLLGMIWLSTFLIQVPLHNKLLVSFEASTHRKLVLTNWIRTGLWSVRGLIAFYLLLTSISSVLTRN